MRYAADMAWPPYPSPGELVRNGFEGMVRYFARKTTSTIGKVWTKQQVEDAHAAGLWVFGVFEAQAQRPYDGKQAGVDDCHLAEQQWTSLGAPDGTVVAYAYDFDADPDAVLAYAEGIRETATFPVMSYCSDGVSQELFRRDLHDFFWQTESTGFRGRWPSPDAHMVQHVGYDRPRMSGDYDENRVMKNFPWWGKEDWFDMATKQDLQDVVNAAVAPLKAELDDLKARIGEPYDPKTTLMRGLYRSVKNPDGTTTNTPTAHDIFLDTQAIRGKVGA